MKIQILSDLHREFGSTAIPKVDADLIILAGDIAVKQNAIPWLREFCADTPTVYICGNHEFYGDKLPKVAQRIESMTSGTNIHLLENDYFSINGWFIYGCTLWTDLNLFGDWRLGSALVAHHMNDYKRIRNSDRGYRRLSPHDTRMIHLLSLQKMSKFFETHDPARTVIVTHHAPSVRSLPANQQNEPISTAYASHLDDFITEHQPHLWIHGHIHISSDYHIGVTRVIANPQGYPSAKNHQFDPQMTIIIHR